MKYGFIKVGAVTPSVKVADVQFNTQNIIEAIENATKNSVKLLVFPELTISAYTCGDLFNQCALQIAVLEGLRDITRATSGIKMLVFVGAILVKNNKLYNCAVAINDGKILGVIPKSHIPTYGEFYEGRYFSCAPKKLSTINLFGEEVPFGTDIIFQAEEMLDFTVSCEICEDLWVANSPSIRHCLAGANIIVNLSCSDELAGKNEYRRSLVAMQSAKLVSGYVYADCGEGESSTDLVFGGHNLITENGNVLAESRLFSNGAIYSEIDVNKLANERQRRASSNACEDVEEHLIVKFSTKIEDCILTRTYEKSPFVPTDKNLMAVRAEEVLSIQAKGLEKRLKHTNIKRAVLGISGGSDSSLALLVTHRAFLNLGYNTKDIICITMPGFGTTSKTKNNSIFLCEALGVTIKTIDITKSVLQHFADIEHDVNLTDVTYENSQARMRTMILMDVANKLNGLVIGTGSLSELALGWATYNGDHMSMYAVNASVPKTLVKSLIAYESQRIGGEVARVLNDILGTAISPELLPPDSKGDIAQKTEDLVGPYLLHDFFLYNMLRWGFEPKKIKYISQLTFKGIFAEEELDKWIKIFYKRFFTQQFKRSCLPDGVKVGSVTLSPRGDWRMPSDAVSKLWLEQL